MSFSSIRLRQVRKEAGYTQKEFAEKITEAGIPVSRSTYQAYETDRFEPSYETVSLMCKLLDVPIAYIYKHDGFAQYDDDIEGNFGRILDYVRELSQKQTKISDDSKKLIANCLDQAIQIYKLDQQNR